MLQICSAGYATPCAKFHYIECDNTSCPGSCSPCDAGYACLGGVRRLCGPGTYSDGQGGEENLLTFVSIEDLCPGLNYCCLCKHRSIPTRRDASNHSSGMWIVLDLWFPSRTLSAMWASVNGTCLLSFLPSAVQNTVSHVGQCKWYMSPALSALPPSRTLSRVGQCDWYMSPALSAPPPSRTLSGVWAWHLPGRRPPGVLQVLSGRLLQLQDEGPLQHLPAGDVVSRRRGDLSALLRDLSLSHPTLPLSQGGEMSRYGRGGIRLRRMSPGIPGQRCNMHRH